MVNSVIRYLFLAVAASALLTACQEGSGGFLTAPATTSGAAGGQVTGAKSVKLVDRDVEAPQVFQTADMALWDGRPSLGGVWVASPDAKDPERVILRNPANGKFVIGALFRREIENPGPKLQISSDAASALGLLAGQPAKIAVTALRREEAPAVTNANKPNLDAAETVATETLPASPAKPTAPATAPVITAQAIPAGTLRPEAVKPVKTGGNIIQIGIFSVEANAKRTAATLKTAGIAADIRPETSQGKPFWSVTTRGDAAALGKVKKAGFKDAYFLKG
ncbi:SPOR domain-containing protein [Cypionkella sp.]|jgi:cell division septation protein DedD|uniref:SPOR domain-containing protein n=1 Tax=Cypionkella sp. TaxID=2811411 RepID=UPI003751AFCC